MKKIKLDDYIKLLTDYHSGGSYKTLKENTKILHKPDYAVMIRTLNFERNDFKNDLIYCDEASYNFLEYSHVVENDILMNKIANPGSVYIMPKVNYNCTCGMNLFLIRFKNINQRYMYYVMKNNEGYIKSKAHGTTTKTITKDEVRDLEFKIHETKEEQDKVEKLLTNIDSKIELNTKVKDTLEEMMKTLYQRWFLEFEFPNEEGKPYKSSGGEMVWNEELKQEIPEDWKNCKIKDLCDVISGYPFSKELYDSEGKYKLITIKNVQDEGINLNTDNNIKNIPEKMPNYCLLKPLNILMSLTGNVGRAGIMFSQNCLLNQRVAILKEKNEKYIPFIYSLFKNDYIRKKLENMSTGTSQLNLSPIETEKLNVPYNEIAIDNYSKITYPYILKIEKLLEENQRLTELRDYLLPMLMNGQINVDDVQI